MLLMLSVLPTTSIQPDWFSSFLKKYVLRAVIDSFVAGIGDHRQARLLKQWNSSCRLPFVVCRPRKTNLRFLSCLQQTYGSYFYFREIPQNSVSKIPRNSEGKNYTKSLQEIPQLYTDTIDRGQPACHEDLKKQQSEMSCK